MDDDVIVFDDVHRRFGERAVLKGLSFRVRRGEVRAFLGRNGCGKTTALRILLGFLRPHAGRAVVLGTNSLAVTPEQRGQIGYVSEDQQLIRWMRVGEVLAFEGATRPRFDHGLAEAAVRRCGLGPKVRVATLSRGQRTQLALIVAVATRPQLLILDDPALGLDVVMRRELLDVMIDLLSEGGVTVLFSSHVLSDVERVADRVSVLHEGRLIVDVPLDDLKRRVQKRLWRAGDGTSPPPIVPGLLRAARRRDGWDLTLVDPQEAVERALRAGGAQLGAPVVPTLDDVFIDLTAGQTTRLLPTGAQPEGTP